MRSKAFFINGGAGRVICSIPAFEKYAETHDDFIIVCEGGTDFYKGHPVLHKHVYDNWHKGLFEKEIKNRDCVTPEPYRNWHYYNQKCNLSQAFDIIINELDEPRELPDPSIYLNKIEVLSGFNVVEEIKAGTGKDKVLVVQPFGRSVEQIGKDFIADSTSRSFSLSNIVDIINELKKDYAVIIMSEIHFPLEEDEENAKIKVARPQITEMRIWASIINVADHFLGCDSMGQHIAKAFGKTSTVVLGSTYPENISYPNSKDFDIIDAGVDRRKYSPIRISMDEEVDRYNDEAMELNREKIQEVVSSVKKRMGKSVAYTNYSNQTTPTNGSCCPKPSIVQGVPLTAQKPDLKLKINKGFNNKSEDIASIIKTIK
jgi:ADP-heptose:LPS heptosyltransferase